MSRPKSHGYAALDPADVADAERGRPDFDLADYTGSRGLEFLDSRSAAGFLAALPGFEEYRFNVMRGALPGGEYGVLFHQALEVPVVGRASISGPLYGTVAKTGGGSWWKPRLPNRTDIPIIGDFLDPPTDDRPAEAFDSDAVWIPTTTAAVNVPEAALPLFLTRIDRRQHHAPFDFAHATTLDGLGLPGWRLRTQNPVASGLVERLMSGPASDVFRRNEEGFFQLLVLRGTVVVRRNGYVRDASELDRLAADVATLAGAVRTACAAEADPLPFATELPPAPAASSNLEVTAGWSDGYRQLADRLGLALEDSDAYHRAFPSLPVPGRAVAVMRGVLPGTAVTGRLVYHCERSLKGAQRARGAVLLPSVPGAAATPPGGERMPDRLLVHEQQGGVAVLWSMATAGFFREEQEELIERAVAFARERGVAAV